MGPRIEARALADHLQIGLKVQSGEQGAHDREQGGFLHDPVGLLRAVFATEGAAVGVGRRGRHARRRQGCAVGHAQMARLVHEQDRHAVGDDVQLLTGRVAALLQLRIVIAETDDQLGVADQSLVRVHPGAGDALQGGDVVALTVGGGKQVGVARLQPDHGDVAVRIEKAGQQGAPVQVQRAGASAHGGARGVQRAHGDDDAVAHGHRLGGRHGVVDGQDRAAGEDHVR